MFSGAKLLGIGVRSTSATTWQHSMSSLLRRLGCSGVIYRREFVYKRNRSRHVYDGPRMTHSPADLSLCPASSKGCQRSSVSYAGCNRLKSFVILECKYNIAETLCNCGVNYPLSYGVPVLERYGSTLLPATREQHDQNCTQSH